MTEEDFLRMASVSDGMRDALMRHRAAVGDGTVEDRTRRRKHVRAQLGVDAVGGDIDVLVDGGIRRGSDVVKALALGAKAVFVGRAYLYGLAVSGEDGVFKVLEILRNGLEETMFGIGKNSIAELSRDDLLFLNRDFLVTPTC